MFVILVAYISEYSKVVPLSLLLVSGYRQASKMFSSSQFESSSGGGLVSSQPTQSDLSASTAKMKQISQASQSGDEKSNFVINNVDASNVTVVGMVFDKTEKVTDVNFVVDDGTGRIGCRRWVNEGFDTMEMEAIWDGMYVRVNGHLKSYQGRVQLVAFSVRPLTNFDEITFHFLDCIYSHLQNCKQLQGGATTQHQMTESRSVSSGYQTAISSPLSSQYSVDGLKDCDQLVLECLRQSSSIGQEKGMHMNEVCQQLKLPLEKIKESMRSLEDEGLIYSTIDEFHYKAT